MGTWEGKCEKLKSLAVFKIMLLSLLNRFQGLKIGTTLTQPLSVTAKAEFHEFGYKKRSRKKKLKKKHQIDPEVNNAKAVQGWWDWGRYKSRYHYYPVNLML